MCLGNGTATPRSRAGVSPKAKISDQKPHQKNIATAAGIEKKLANENEVTNYHHSPLNNNLDLHL